MVVGALESVSKMAAEISDDRVGSSLRRRMSGHLTPSVLFRRLANPIASFCLDSLWEKSQN
jgi:hypothetical protein